jgi:small conductance mechanosensitive channel
MDKTNTFIYKLQDKATDFAFANGPKILSAIAILLAGLLVARWLGAVVTRALNKRDMEPPVRMLISRIVKLLVVAVALVMALGTAGVDVMTLVAGIGVAGVGIGLAAQGILSNIFAGLTIIFTKPFRVDEYIELVGVQGQVKTIELVSTTLLHSDLSRVVIPNRKIIGEILHNYGTIRQLSLSVGIGYRSNVNEVLAEVRDVLSKNPRVLKDPAPAIGVATLGDSAINISVCPWVKLPDAGPAPGELYEAIIDRFRARQIEVPFPQREVRLLNQSEVR